MPNLGTGTWFDTVYYTKHEEYDSTFGPLRSRYDMVWP